MNKPISIRNARIKAGLSLREAARRLGVTHPYLSAVELGSKKLNTDFASRLSSLYSVPLENFDFQVSEIESQYIQWIRSQVRRWDSRFILPMTPAISCTVADLFVTPQFNSEKGKLDFNTFKSDLYSKDTIKLLSGETGSGKSFLMRLLTLETGDELQKAMVPFLVSLGSFVITNGNILRSLADYYISLGIAHTPEELEHFISTATQNGKSLFLFDGLDEIIETKQRAFVLAQIEQFQEEIVKGTGSLLILSGQPESYQMSLAINKNYSIYSISKWNSNQLQEGVKKWIWSDTADAEQFWTLIQSNDIAFELARWPLMFYLLATLYSAYGSRALQDISTLCNAICEVLENSWKESRKALSSHVTHAKISNDAPWIKWRDYLIYVVEKKCMQLGVALNPEDITFSRIELKEAWQEYLTLNSIQRFSITYNNLDEIIESQTGIGPLILKKVPITFDESLIGEDEYFKFIHPIFSFFYVSKAYLNNIEKIEDLILSHVRDVRWKYGIPLIIQELSRSERTKDKNLAFSLVDKIISADDELGLERTYGIGRWGLFTAIRAISCLHYDRFSDSVIKPFLELLNTSYYERDVSIAFEILGDFPLSQTFRTYFQTLLEELDPEDHNTWRIASALAKLGANSKFVVEVVKQHTKIISKDYESLEIEDRLELKRIFWGLRLIGRTFSLHEENVLKDSHKEEIDAIINSVTKFANTVIKVFKDEISAQKYLSFQMWDVMSVLINTLYVLRYRDVYKHLVEKVFKVILDNPSVFQGSYPYKVQLFQFMKAGVRHSQILNKKICKDLYIYADSLNASKEIQKILSKDIIILKYQLISQLEEQHTRLDEPTLYATVLGKQKSDLINNSYAFLSNLKEVTLDNLSDTGVSLYILSNFRFFINEYYSKEELVILIRNLINVLDVERRRDKETSEQLHLFTRPFSAYSATMYDHIYNTLGKLAELLPLRVM